MGVIHQSDSIKEAAKKRKAEQDQAKLIDDLRKKVEQHEQFETDMLAGMDMLAEIIAGGI